MSKLNAKNRIKFIRLYNMTEKNTTVAKDLGIKVYLKNSRQTEKFTYDKPTIKGGKELAN